MKPASFSVVRTRVIAERAARYRVVCAAAIVFALACPRHHGGAAAVEADVEITSSIRTAASAALAKRPGAFRVGEPYVIAGRTYVPRIDPTYTAEGIASWYGGKFHGRLTANGEIYNMHAVSAAHPTLPLPSYVRITNLQTRRSLIVRLNDRGPYFDNRLIDVSFRAAKLLGFHERGLAPVRVEYIGPASLDGSDDEKLASTLRDDNPTVAADDNGPVATLPPVGEVTPADAGFPRVIFD
jgi:rare lipoprotein A